LSDPAQSPAKKPCRFPETPCRGRHLGKSGSNRQKIPLSIERIKKNNLDDDAGFMADRAGPLEIF
jgi:hypothetical protein